MEIFETRRHQSNQNNACMECNACVARCMLQCDAMFCHGVLYVVFGLCIYAMIFIEGEPMGQGIPDDHPPVKGLIISNPTVDSRCLYNVIHPMKYPHQYPMKSLNPHVLWCFFELTWLQSTCKKHVQTISNLTWPWLKNMRKPYQTNMKPRCLIVKPSIYVPSNSTNRPGSSFQLRSTLFRSRSWSPDCQIVEKCRVQARWIV